jgi:pimeloyl-ACP methyl ester carboxylesterase
LAVFALPERASMQEQQVNLASGTSMQMITSLPDTLDSSKPPILFLHGSFHAAWCWSENFMPYFASKGYPVAALSWRGTGGTFAGDSIKKVKIMEHVEDLKCVLNHLPEIIGLDTNAKPPVVVAHSFGGLAVMKAFEEDGTMPSKFGGIVMMCCVPPSGNGKMTMRYLRRSLIDSYKITAGFAMKRCLKNEDLCRQLFFGGKKTTLEDGSIEDYGVSDSDVKRYQEYFARDSEATIDLLDLAKKLPSSKADGNGRAPFVSVLPPCLVMGAKDDFIVDKEGVEETARYFGLDRPTIVDSPHDVMLGAKWENAANELSTWLSNTF